MGDFDAELAAENKASPEIVTYWEEKRKKEQAEHRRYTALSFAVQFHQNQPSNAENAVSDARVFEVYLEGTYEGIDD